MYKTYKTAFAALPRTCDALLGVTQNMRCPAGRHLEHEVPRKRSYASEGVI